MARDSCIFLLLLARLISAESVLLNLGCYILLSTGAHPAEPCRFMPINLNFQARISKLVATRTWLSFHLTFMALTVPLRLCIFSYAQNKVLLISLCYYLNLQSQTDFFPSLCGRVFPLKLALFGRDQFLSS